MCVFHSSVVDLSCWQHCLVVCMALWQLPTTCPQWIAPTHPPIYPHPPTRPTSPAVRYFPPTMPCSTRNMEKADPSFTRDSESIRLESFSSAPSCVADMAWRVNSQQQQRRRQ